MSITDRDQANALSRLIEVERSERTAEILRQFLRAQRAEKRIEELREALRVERERNAVLESKLDGMNQPVNIIPMCTHAGVMGREECPYCKKGADQK